MTSRNPNRAAGQAPGMAAHAEEAGSLVASATPPTVVPAVGGAPTSKTRWSARPRTDLTPCGAGPSSAVASPPAGGRGRGHRSVPPGGWGRATLGARAVCARAPRARTAERWTGGFDRSAPAALVAIRPERRSAAAARPTPAVTGAGRALTWSPATRSAGDHQTRAAASLRVVTRLPGPTRRGPAQSEPALHGRAPAPTTQGKR